MTQRDDDWARMVISWIEQAERQMDEAYREGNGRAYLTARTWRYDLRTALEVIDPTARMRFATTDAAQAIRAFGASIERTRDAANRLGEALG